MAAEFRLSRRIAALSATYDSDSAGATAAAPAPATFADSFAEELAEGVQGLQLARQEIT